MASGCDDDKMKNLEKKVDYILKLLQPTADIRSRNFEKKHVNATESTVKLDPSKASLPDFGMSVYVKEIQHLKNKLEESQNNLEMTRKLLLQRQMKAYHANCNSLPKIPLGGTSARITRKGSIELKQMPHMAKGCPIPPPNPRGKALFRLLKANDKECFYLCPDYHVQEAPQSTNLVRLVWIDTPKRVLLIKKPGDPEIRRVAFEIAHWLHTEMKMEVYVEPVVKRGEASHLDFTTTYAEEDANQLQELIDFVVCLGGDGTLLWLSNMFKNAVPPVISFAMGSLGFLTPFPATMYKHYLTQIIQGGFYLTLRSRLQGTVEHGDPNIKSPIQNKIPKNLGKRPSWRRTTTTEIPDIKHLLGHFESSKNKAAINNTEKAVKKDSRKKSSEQHSEQNSETFVDPPVHPGLPAFDDEDETPNGDCKPKDQLASSKSGHLVNNNDSFHDPHPGNNGGPQRASSRNGSSGNNLKIPKFVKSGSAISVIPKESGIGDQTKSQSKRENVEVHMALNEVIVDNAKTSSLTNLDCYCDGVFTTKCQGDGLIVATPTGSTAYSLSAGGSMVHPQVPGILFTPVCPHSLSFRPIVFPDTSKISIRVSRDARGDHSVAFDGKSRITLHKGDTVHISVSSWPIPAICRVSETDDWFTGVRSLLHWNLRTPQKKMKNDDTST